MNNQITIEQLQEAIKDYQEAVDAAGRFTDTFEYEDYLHRKRMTFGICSYFGKYFLIDFIDKYVDKEGWIYNFTCPDNINMQQMRFCVEIRLTTLKWELGLRLAEEQLNQSKP